MTGEFTTLHCGLAKLEIVGVQQMTSMIHGQGRSLGPFLTRWSYNDQYCLVLQTPEAHITQALL